MDQSTAVRAIAQELNPGDRSGRSTHLARLTGASVATIRSWGASGSSEERKRAMTPTARRLLFVLLALHREGHDLDALRSAARRLELRQGWATHREALDELFSDEFQQLVVEFDSMDDSFVALVDRLEDIADASGGEVDDDDRHKRVTYSRGGTRFTFDLDKRRLEVAFGRKSALELVDAAQQFQLGVARSSPMLAAPSRSSRSADDEA